jgi:hypothetical protein
MAAGDFSATALQDVYIELDRMFPGNRTQKENVTEVETARAILENQTAQFEILENKIKDYEVQVTWLDTCGITARECTPDCTITGPELESKKQLYTLDLCQEAAFSVDLEKFRTNTLTREDVVPKGIARIMEELDKYVAEQAALKLDASAGYNSYVNGYTWDNANKTTVIPATDYNRKIAAYLMLAARRNRITNPYMIDDGNIWQDLQNALIDSGNSDGKGDGIRAQMQRWYYDFVTFLAAGVPENTFMVDPNAIGIANKTRWAPTPTSLPDEVAAMSVPSRNLPGIEYDLYTQTVCQANADNDGSKYVQSFKVKFKGGVFVNPNNCGLTVDISGTPTTVYSNGILAFRKGS